ncbi:MAG: VanZ family protein [Deltaproteobacteria bacterium]|nr:VanZ family protein [Deltaproteobacteria bacterium]
MTIPEMKRSHSYRELAYRAPVLAYAGLIFLLSSVPRFPDVFPSFFGFDKIVHFSEYYLFGCLIRRWLGAERSRFANQHAVILTILIGTFYGISDEWHQSFVAGRDASIWDAFIDALAVATAASTYLWILRRIPLFKTLA